MESRLYTHRDPRPESFERRHRRLPDRHQRATSRAPQAWTPDSDVCLPKDVRFPAA